MLVQCKECIGAKGAASAPNWQRAAERVTRACQCNQFAINRDPVPKPADFLPIERRNALDEGDAGREIAS
ncbi:hypothetical protein GCM10009424_20940 [Sphingomonas ursincola]